MIPLPTKQMDTGMIPKRSWMLSSRNGLWCFLDNLTHGLYLWKTRKLDFMRNLDMNTITLHYVLNMNTIISYLTLTLQLNML